jgi:hypothetical protein
MATFTVTATQGGTGTSNGMVLRVYVLTGTAATQNGGAATQSASAVHEISLTTTVTGSRVYGATIFGTNVAGTPDAQTTGVDAIADVTHNKAYNTWKAASTTGTPGATTFGYTNAATNGGTAGYEVLPAGTIAEDGSAPAVVSTTAAITLTTASFTPPAGSLLVLLCSTNSGTNALSQLTVTDTSGLGLTWTAMAEAKASNMKYAGVWIAQIPAAAVQEPLPIISQYTGFF